MIEAVRADAIRAGDIASMPETDWTEPRRVENAGRLAGAVVLIVEDADGNFDYGNQIIISAGRSVQRHT